MSIWESSKQKWVKYYILVLMLLLFLACGSVPSNTSNNSLDNTSSVNWEWYSNNEAGLSFQYPDFLTIQTDTQKDRGPSGELITMVNVTAIATEPVVGLMVRGIEDPLRDQMFPNLYPPSEQTFRILVVSDIADLTYDDTESNKSSIMTAGERSVMTTISGFDAATYHLGLDNMEIGHIYIRGALVITPVRDISLYIIGSDESNAPDSVSSKYIDDLWSKFVNSLEIDY